MLSKYHGINFILIKFKKKKKINLFNGKSIHK